MTVGRRGRFGARGPVRRPRHQGFKEALDKLTPIRFLSGGNAATSSAENCDTLAILAFAGIGCTVGEGQPEP